MILGLDTSIEPYCMKCGDTVANHDEEFCSSSKYPALKVEFEYLFKIAKLYNFDLSDANSKQADNGRHGAVEGDIWLDTIALVHQYTVKQTPLMNNENMLSMSMIDFAKNELQDWGYEPEEIVKVCMKIQEAKN